MSFEFDPQEGFQSSRARIFLRRLRSVTQMDFEYSLWQMLHLCIAPKRVYRSTTLHKQTKNQWARDDPAFVVLQVLFLSISAILYATVYRSGGLGSFLSVFLRFIVIDVFVCGLGTATMCWYYANKNLRVTSVHVVEQSVEWMYSLDVHFNSYFPMFMLTHVVQFILLPVLNSAGVLSEILSNAIYIVAFSYYFYVTFLGYMSLPFLDDTVVFLYPAAFTTIGLLVLAIIGANPTILFLRLHGL